jgi:hypothetical protein
MEQKRESRSVNVRPTFRVEIIRIDRLQCKISSILACARPQVSASAANQHANHVVLLPHRAVCKRPHIGILLAMP